MDRQYSPERMDAMELVNKAHMLLNVGNYEAAAPLLEEALQKDPLYIKAHIEKGNMYMLQDRYEDALKAYNDGLLVDKQDGELHFHIGNIFLLIDRFSDAVISYGKAEDLGYVTKDLVENLALCYEQLDEYDAALSAYSRASLMNPDDPAPRMLRIQLQLRHERFDSARSALTDFIQRFPHVVEGYEAMVDVLINKNEYEEAESFIKDALDVFPDAAALYAQQARIYAMMDRLDDGLAVIEKARQQPDAEQVAQVLDRYEANLLLLKNDVDGGIKVYQRLVDQEPEGELDVESRVTLMNLLNGAQRYEELLKATTSALNTPEADDQLCMAYALQPWALDNLGRQAEAEPLYRNAIIKLRNIGLHNAARMDTYMYRALCHRGLKEYQKALDTLDIFEDLGVRNAEVYRFKATLYNDMGDSAKEKEQLALAEKYAN